MQGVQTIDLQQMQNMQGMQGMQVFPGMQGMQMGLMPQQVQVMQPGTMMISGMGGNMGHAVVQQLPQQMQQQQQAATREVSFEFESTGDRRGILYFIGSGQNTRPWRNPTERGTGVNAGDTDDAAIEVLASSLERGDLKMVADWEFQRQNFQTRDGGQSWVTIDLRHFEVCPAVYCMAHSADLAGRHYIRSWTLQGSGDGQNFESLDIRTNDQTISQSAPWSAFATPPCQKFYRYLRINLSDRGSSDGGSVLSINCFEVYGRLRSASTQPQPLAQQQQVQVQQQPAWQQQQPQRAMGGGAGFGGSAPIGMGGKGGKRGPGGGGKGGGGGWQQGGGGGQGGKKGGGKKGGGGKAQRDPQQREQQREQQQAQKAAKLAQQAGKGAPNASARGRFDSAKGGQIPFPFKGKDGKGGKGRAEQEPHPPTWPQGTSQFSFEAPGDRRGVIFHLGCALGAENWQNPVSRGAVSVSASSIRKGHPNCVCDHTFIDQIFFTDDAAPSWVQVDLRDYAVRPTHYCFGHRYRVTQFFARNWELHGSRDGSEGSFQVIKQHVDDETLCAERMVGDWALDVPETAFFRVFRIVMPEGGNSSGTAALVCSCFEVYGNLGQLPEELRAPPLPTSSPAGADPAMEAMEAQQQQMSVGDGGSPSPGQGSPTAQSAPVHSGSPAEGGSPAHGSPAPPSPH